MRDRGTGTAEHRDRAQHRMSLGIAWQRAAADLGIDVVSPYSLDDRVEFVALVRDFGSPKGMLILDSPDTERVAVAQREGFGYSCMDSPLFQTYHRRLFIDTLTAWGWTGAPRVRPDWYAGTNAPGTNLTGVLNTTYGVLFLFWLVAIVLVLATRGLAYYPIATWACAALKLEAYGLIYLGMRRRKAWVVPLGVFDSAWAIAASFSLGPSTLMGAVATRGFSALALLQLWFFTRPATGRLLGSHGTRLY